MPASPDPDGPSRRVAMLAGTGRYDHPDEWEELDQVEAALATVADCLEGIGYRPVRATSYLLNPTKDELGFFFRSTPANAEVVIAYYTGHGHVDGLHYLVARNTSVRAPEFITGSAIPTRELPSLLAVRDRDSGRRSSPQPYLLIIVDTCFSGAGAIQITRDELSEVVDPDRTWVLVSARPTEYAQQGAFPAALRRALADATAGRTQPYVHPDVLAGSINSQLPKWQRVRSHPPASGVEEPPPFFPNPECQPVPAGLTLTDQAHWVSRLRGTAEPATGYYITGGEGRTAAVREISGWISDPDRGPVAVVTSRPGSGKSALLALPALITDPAYRENLLAAAGDRPIVRAASLVRPGTRVIAVHGRGLNADQLAGAIAAGLGRDAGTTSGLLAVLGRESVRDQPVVLLDALDETVQPGVVASQLVTELVRHGLRLLIGTRQPLLQAIANPSLLIDLDKEPYADAEALTDYVAQLLVASREPGVITPYQPLQLQDAGTLATIAATVSAKAAGSFLIGQLVALALRGRDRVVGTDHLDDIPGSVGEAFDADLARLGSRSPHARVLLTALAWAKGLGLPWENIWVPVANAIRPALATPTPEPLRDEDIRWLRDEAGAYIIEDTGPGGRSVFRPFHDLLSAHLRASGEAPGHETVSASHRERVNGLVTDALIAGVQADATGARLWAQAHPYLRSYLAQHAADAEAARLTALLTDPGYLAAADPTTLLPLLMQKQPPELAVTSSVYRRAAPHLGTDVRWNAAYLQEAALVFGARRLWQAFAADRLAPAFDTVIAEHPTDTSLLTISGNTWGVEALAAVPLPGGQALLASGGTDGMVRLWDLATGQPAGPPLKGHLGWVVALAAVPLPGGQALLASGGTDGAVRLWDPATGQPAGPPLAGHPGWVRALAAVPLPGGQILLASAGDDGMVRLWDPATGQPAGPPLAGHPDAVRALAAVPLPGGQILLASAGDDGMVRLWDPVTGQPAGPPLEGHRTSVRALAAVPLPGGRTLLASGDDWGTVRLWDPATGQPAGPPLEGHPSSVPALAAVPLPGGQTRLASGGDGLVRMWDPATGQPGPPLEGHTGWVVALAAVSLPGGQALLASGGQDGTVRLWDPATGQPTGRPRKRGRLGKVRALAVVPLPGGQALLASGGQDGTVRLWDPATGQPTGRLQKRRGPDAVLALAAVPLPDGQTRLASGGGDGRVRLWDPATGQRAGPPLAGHHPDLVRALAAVPLPGGQALLASGGDDSMVRLWDPATGEPVGPPLEGRTGWVRALAAVPLPGGQALLASGSQDGTVRLWDPATGESVGPPLAGHPGTVQALAAVPLPGGQTLLASGSQDGTVRLWDPATGESVGPPLAGHPGTVWALAAVPLPGGQILLASGGIDHAVRLWNPVNGRLAARIASRASTFTLLGWQGSFLAIGADDGLTVIALASLPRSSGAGQQTDITSSHEPYAR